MSTTEMSHESTQPQNFLRTSRRQFLQRGAMAVAATAAFPYIGTVLGANSKIDVACIGCGGKGDSDSSEVAHAGGNVVALCDVDEHTLARKAKQFPKARLFHDYRKMLETMNLSMDAVTVSIPDHNHGVASAMALRMHKAVYCQKPLCQTLYECELLRRLAQENHLATQMGNQGSADSGLRRGVEVVQSGIIGNITELHVWTNRPIWPQGMPRPIGADPVPAGLHWEQWLGPAPVRPFKKGVYHPFAWRGFKDFGTGAQGDMACHTVNMPYRGLKLGYPSLVQCEETSQMYADTYPKTSRIRFEFPEREGMVPLKFWWYAGNPQDHEVKPLRPPAEAVKEIVDMQGRLPGSGALLIGDKGKIFSPDDYGTQFFVKLTDDKEYVSGTKHPAATAVPMTIPRLHGGGGDDQMQKEDWFRMIRGEGPSYSNFDIAAALAEIILLGCVAMRIGVGKDMQWDGAGMYSPNRPEAAEFIRRENRRGWES
jgi:Oxidoreductase family, NAD-binding Rossmann fold/Oxidoreductase family, C-terminal alpha/beta domain